MICKVSTQMAKNEPPEFLEPAKVYPGLRVTPPRNQPARARNRILLSILLTGLALVGVVAYIAIGY